jgi:hypothetical protein
MGPARPPAGLVERCADDWERALRRRAGDGGGGQLWLAQLFAGAVRGAAGATALSSLRLDRPVARALREAGLDEEASQRQAELALVLAAREPVPAVNAPVPAPAGAAPPPGGTLEGATLGLLGDERARAFLRVNEHGGTTWFDKQRFEDLVRGLALCEGEPRDDRAAPGAARTGARPGTGAQALIQLAAGCGYRLDEMVKALRARQPPS